MARMPAAAPDRGTPPAPAAGGDAEILETRVASIAQATHDIRIVRLAPTGGAPFAYAAGQYARVAFDGSEERDYSIASRPSEPELEFHIRDIGGGPSRYVAERLSVGDRVPVRGPFGDTYLRPDRPGPIVCVAGGSGLGQMRAIAAEALARGLGQPIHLYFGARAERDVYLEDEMRDLTRRHGNFRFVPVLSEPDDDSGRRTGMVTDALAADAPDLGGAVAYLAGPPPMVAAAMEALAALGVERADIHADAFIGEAERKAREGER